FSEIPPAPPAFFQTGYRCNPPKDHESGGSSCVPAFHAANRKSSYHLGVTAHILEFLAQIIQLTHELTKLLAVDRGLQIKVEHELEIPVRDGSGFQLDHIDSQYIQSGQNLIQGTGLVGQHHHDAGLVRTGIDFQILADADKAGTVVALVLNAVCQAA